MTNGRPPLGAVKIGTPVTVTDPNARANQRTDASIIKASPVWLTIQETDVTGRSPRTWKMRRDSQNEATGYGHGGCYFRTTEQQAWENATNHAYAYLRDYGIRVDSTVPHQERRALALTVANLLRQHNGLAPIKDTP